jgi:ethanolamine permease
MARAGFLPGFFATVHPTRKTPHWAILAGGVIGIIAIFSDSLIQIGGQPLTANIVTMSVFGAILLYIVSMLSLFKLRRSEAALERPFKAPFYPVFPAIALLLSLLFMATMIYYNALVFGLFVGLFAISLLFYFLSKKSRAAVAGDDLLLAAPGAVS